MKVINTLNRISNIYSKGTFDINLWKEYINGIYPDMVNLCLEDLKESIDTGLITFEMDILPLLNEIMINNDLRNKVQDSFKEVTNDLEEKVKLKFGKTLDVEIILYLGMCNGAGWVTTLNSKTVVLLGIEKIMELEWCDIDSMYGLIYHELGHVYQAQYGILDRTFDNNRYNYLWQLFTEGIAMYFEQVLVGDFNYYHQDKNGWKEWCDMHINQIKEDFNNDLETMTFDDQRYFGDWVNYYNHNDVGYYLGARFLQFICQRYVFDDVLSFDIDVVDKLFKEFLED